MGMLLRGVSVRAYDASGRLWAGRPIPGGCSPFLFVTMTCDDACCLVRPSRSPMIFPGNLCPHWFCLVCQRFVGESNVCAFFEVGGVLYISLTHTQHTTHLLISPAVAAAVLCIFVFAHP